MGLIFNFYGFLILILWGYDLVIDVIEKVQNLCGWLGVDEFDDVLKLDGFPLWLQLGQIDLSVKFTQELVMTRMNENGKGLFVSLTILLV